MSISKVQRRDFIALLPLEIGLKILTHLTVEELKCCQAVSKLWQQAASTPCLWKHKWILFNGRDPNCKECNWEAKVLSLMRLGKKNPKLTVHFVRDQIESAAAWKQYLVLKTDEGQLKIYDYRRKKIIISFPCNCRVRKMAVYKNQLILSIVNETGELWELTKGQFKESMHVALNDCCIDRNEFYCQFSGLIVEWDMEAFHVSRAFQPLNFIDDVCIVAVRGDWMVFSAYTVLYITDRNQRFQFSIFGPTVLSDAAELIGDILIYSLCNGRVKLWNLKKRKCILTLRASAAVHSLVFCDGQLFGFSKDKKMFQWDFSDRDLA